MSVYHIVWESATTTTTTTCGFISIEMAKIVVGSPSLTQPLLLYPGLGPAMLDNIGGVSLGIGIKHYSNTVLLTALHVVVCLRHMLWLDCFYLFTRCCVIM
jgi:hypothetical protein